MNTAIFKIILPKQTTSPKPKAIVYSKDKKVTHSYIAITRDLKKTFRNDRIKYFECKTSDKGNFVEIVKEVTGENW